MEESTTLEDGLTQGKTCYLGRFLDSHSFARNDMLVGGFVQLHGLYMQRGRRFYLCARCSYNVKRRTAPHPPPAGGPPSPKGKVLAQTFTPYRKTRAPKARYKSFPWGKLAGRSPD